LLFSKAGANVLLFFIRASPISKKNHHSYLNC
jgi:hypothetical protein